MKVAGKIVHDLDGLLKEFLKLPRGINRVSGENDSKFQIATPDSVRQLYYRTRVTITDSRHQNRTSLLQCMDVLETCRKLPADTQKSYPRFWSILHEDISEVEFRLGNYESSITVMRQAASMAELNNDRTMSAKHNSELYNRLHQIIKNKLLLATRLEELRQELPALREKVAELHKSYSVVPANPTTHFVGQEEVGFSSKEAMGGINIRQCIAVAIKHPITGKTAYAHIGELSERENVLTELFARVGKKTETDPPYLVRLIGAGQEPPNDDVAIRANEAAQQNFIAVLDSLFEYDVDILSAWVMESNIPSSVAIYPESFEFREEVAQVDIAEREGITVGCAFDNGKKPLRVCFDLTASKEKAPALLSKITIASIRKLLVGKNEIEIYDVAKKISYGSANDHVLYVATSLLSLRDQYLEAYNHLEAKIDATVAAIPSGIQRPAKSGVDVVKKYLAVNAIHVGPNHETANKELADFIETKLFVSTAKALNTNLNGLNNFKFTTEAIDSVIKQFGNTYQSGIQQPGSLGFVLINRK